MPRMSTLNAAESSASCIVFGRSFSMSYMWVKVFKNGPSNISGRHHLKSFTWSILEYLDPHKAVIEMQNYFQIFRFLYNS